MLNMKKPIILLGSLFGVVVMLSIIRISLVNSISTTGVELVDIQTHADELKKQNELLKEQYLQAASYTTISQKAKSMGFAPAKSHLNMAAPLPLAKR
jgi:cell division protein FtsL